MLEKRVLDLFNIISNESNVILFIDEIHSLVGTGRSLSQNSLDIANIIKPFITSDDIHLVGATTDYEYEDFIQSDPAFSRRFSNIVVNEPNDNILFEILEHTIYEYSKLYNIKVDKNLVKDISSSLVIATGTKKRNINNFVCNPDLAIGIISKAFGYARLYDKHQITEKEFIKAYNSSDKVIGDLIVKSNKKNNTQNIIPISKFKRI